MSRPGRKPCRLQYSLRTLFVLTLVVAVLTAVLIEQHRVRTVRRAVAGLEQAGAVVFYEGAEGERAGTAQPPGTERVSWFAADVSSGRVTKVWMYSPRFCDRDMRHLSALPDLEELFLWRMPAYYTEAHGRFDLLKNFDVSDLGKAQVTDAGLVHLRRLRKLQRLNLSGTHVTDAGLRHLRGLHTITAVSLAGTHVTDRGLAELQHLPELRWLNLKHTRISDNGVRHLLHLRKLEHLNLGHTSISDAGVAQVGKLANLKALGIAGTLITDMSINPLMELEQIEHLDLRGSEITPEGYARLQRALPKAEVAY